ncbi:hypothetical protein [Paenibacillus sp. 23TSA30-6]|uniref:hypothetical protein n=1 Tax=Paenibacillus sp. 23TSA30-6 TaxID=2546104 RepID=UPI00178814D3|nr:hypothetical protein [Paenibacillus sp. 23TSA30-6]MBE0338719.1 hypothetical protein [Paenibacillus sp. 23TSA30-6]
MKEDLISRINGQEFSDRWDKFPKRILLDTNIIQITYNFGDYIYDVGNLSDEIFSSRSGKRVLKSQRLHSEVVCLRELFRGIDRTNIEFAVSRSVHREVEAKNDSLMLSWFLEWADYFDGFLAQYEKPPWSGKGKEAALQAANDKTILSNLSEKDRRIFLDCLELECNAILTYDKYRNTQDWMYKNYGIMILYPSDLWRFMKEFGYLWY